MKQIELVFRVVDEIDSTATGNDGEAEQSPRAVGKWRRDRRIERSDRRHCARQGRLDYIAVTAVDREDIVVRRDCQTKRTIERNALRYGRPEAVGLVTIQRIRN